MKKKRNKVIVAMSGGVDSSVAAALLKSRGFDVTGVFMEFWKAPGIKREQSWNRCCNPESAERARAVARKISIPFYVVNFSAEFKGVVVDYFLREYKEGRTPNPCVVCNKKIKFGLLLKKMSELKIGYIATGHYARIIKDNLFMAKDKDKDQTYFLWQLKQSQLKNILFPIGDYTKKQVRTMAKKFNLPTAETPESQEVCFIETTTFDFLKKYLGQKPGLVVDEDNNEIGEHKGLWFYTIGQRKGIGLGGGPYFVVSKNIKANELIVSRNKELLGKKEITIKNVNWFLAKPIKLPMQVMAKIRYNGALAPAVIDRIKPEHYDKTGYKRGYYKVMFSKPQVSVASGQSLVMYQKARVDRHFVVEKLIAAGIIL